MSIFLTGTDTECGKTFAACALLRSACAAGIAAAGMKPVASGADQTADGWRNDDALRLMAASAVDLPYEIVNPCLFRAPASPHAAAAAEGREVDFDRILEAYDVARAAADCVVVEGVGGWRVPLSETRQLVDLVKALELPVVLIVGLKLGCINHALLTLEALKRDNVKVKGWIANSLDDNYAFSAETVAVIAAAAGQPSFATLRLNGSLEVGRGPLSSLLGLTDD